MPLIISEDGDSTSTTTTQPVTQTPDVAVDLETGQISDVSDPYNPVDITPTPIAEPPPKPVQPTVDYETGKIYDTSTPYQPTELKYEIVKPPPRTPGHEVIEADDTELIKYNQAIADLSKYRSGEGYDIGRYLRDGGSEKKLRDAGFKSEDIKAAKDYVPALTQFLKEYYENKGWDYSGKEPQITAISGEKYKAQLKANAEWREKMEKATKAYIEKYGKGAYAGSVAGKTLSFVFSPARALAPDVSLKDIRPMEWGVGAAQVVLVALPGIGFVAGKAGGAVASSIATKVATAAAGGVFTAQTVMEWENMSPAERALSVAMDTLIIGSAVPWGRVTTTITKTGDFVKATAKDIKQAIKNIKPKSQPEVTFTQELGNTKLLTEGGKVGAGYNTYTDLDFINAVSKGEKPSAIVFSKEAADIAKQKGLFVETGTTPEYLSGTTTKPPQNYVIFQNTAEGRLAYNRLMNARKIDTTTAEGFIKYHTEVGKALGYEPKHIRAYLEHNANLDIAFGRDFRLKNALSKIAKGIAEKDELLIKQGARQLQLAGRTVPKELGGGVIVKRGQLIEANAKDYIKLSETKPPSGLSQTIKNNQSFIDNAERALKQATKPERKAAIERALKEAKRQKKLAVKEKAPTILEDMPEFPTGKYPLAKGTKTTTALVPKKDVKVKGLSGKSKTIPREAFKNKTIPAIATKYKVSERELVIAISKQGINPYAMPYRTEQLTTTTKSKEETETETKVVPGVTPSPETKTQPEPKPEVKPEPAPAPSPYPSPEPMPKPAPAPYPSPKPGPEPSTKTIPITINRNQEGNKPSRNDLPEKEKRQIIAQSGGAIAFRMGELNGKDIWHVVFEPYARDSHFTLVGRSPSGATLVRGPDSVRKTAKLLYGKQLDRQLMIDIGAMDVDVEPIGESNKIRIGFKSDPHLETTGDITIGDKHPTITQKGKLFPLRQER